MGHGASLPVVSRSSICKVLWGMDVQPAMWQPLTVGVVIALVSSGATMVLSQRRFCAERRWEKKLDAYLRIIHALHDMQRYVHELIEEELEGYSRLPEERKAILAQRWVEARDELLRARDLGEFLISDEAASSLVDLEHRLRRGRDLQYYFEQLESDAEALENCLNAVKSRGKADLDGVLAYRMRAAWSRLGDRATVRQSKWFGRLASQIPLTRRGTNQIPEPSTAEGAQVTGLPQL